MSRENDTYEPVRVQFYDRFFGRTDCYAGEGNGKFVGHIQETVDGSCTRFQFVGDYGLTRLDTELRATDINDALGEVATLLGESDLERVYKG